MTLTTELYLAHVAEKLERFQGFCHECELDAIIISSGQMHMQFMDDMAYPFRANPYFKEWLPLNKRYNSFLMVPATGRPSLFLDVAEDIWHTPPQELPSTWESAFNVVEFEGLPEIDVANQRIAYLGEHNEFELAAEQCNPEQLRFRIDYQRRFKTNYEQECVREANKIAARGHMAARSAFYSAASELEIKLAYLGECRQSDDEMPYSIIAGLNEHAAVLHHFILDNTAPKKHHSFLIDAGVDVNGYASDITRTWAFDTNSEYAQLIAAMDAKQLEMTATLSAGGSAVVLHELSHLKISELLVDFGVVNCTAESCVASGLSSTFYPHGIGHGLGVNVHELGGHMANPQGESVPPPEAYPRLRNTAEFAVGSINTVEPGLYFIPTLLAKLRGSALEKEVNWAKVEEMTPYGGVRIEDNILVTENGIENITRDAFAAI
ncbi:MAG: Xaa-Pro dipeptidase [Pseudomonadales bacterium]